MSANPSRAALAETLTDPVLSRAIRVADVWVSRGGLVQQINDLEAMRGDLYT